MRNNSFLNTLSVLVIAASAAVLWFNAVPSLNPADARLQSDLGRALAQEALKLGQPSGKITAFVRDTDAFPSPATETALASFLKELKQAGRAEPTIQRQQMDPLRPLQVPSGDFAEALRRGAAGDVIVSFMGPPVIPSDKRASIGTVRAKVVAFCPGSIPEQVDLRFLADAGLLHAAILNRPSSGSGAMPANPRPTVFDDLYVRASLTELSARQPISNAQ